MSDMRHESDALREMKAHGFRHWSDSLVSHVTLYDAHDFEVDNIVVDGHSNLYRVESVNGQKVELRHLEPIVLKMANIARELTKWKYEVHDDQ